ncbi:MAG: glycine zipper family protein [Phycisphaeraceae bacterium]|nr:glycine zipper family protein [Phycisphaeraceae bacterium]
MNGKRGGTWTAVVLAGALTLAAGMSGCNNAGEGAVAGGVIGALAGLGIGSVTGSSGRGAAIGAISGAVGGAIIGDQNERRSRGW